MPVTIHDLARFAGVNASTVSRALRGDERIRVSTREKIETLAKEHGYILNLPARQLAAGKTGVIWFCFGSLDSEIERQAAAYLEEFCYNRNYDLQLILHQNQPDRFRRKLERLRQRAADGAILLPPGNTEGCHDCADFIRDLPISCVFIDRYWPDLNRPVVTTDNATAAQKLAERCISWGARRFLLDYSGPNIVAQTRFKATAEFLTANNLPYTTDPTHLDPDSSVPLGILSSCGKGSAQQFDVPRIATVCPVFGGFFDYWENQSLEGFTRIVICRQNFKAIAESAGEWLLAELDDPTTTERPAKPKLFAPQIFEEF